MSYSSENFRAQQKMAHQIYIGTNFEDVNMKNALSNRSLHFFIRFLFLCYLIFLLTYEF